MVPKLREVHVLRDAWTKLKVLPAKIMQICFHCILYVTVNLINIARIGVVRVHHYITKDPPPDDAGSVNSAIPRSMKKDF